MIFKVGLSGGPIFCLQGQRKVSIAELQSSWADINATSQHWADIFFGLVFFNFYFLF